MRVTRKRPKWWWSETLILKLWCICLLHDTRKHRGGKQNPSSLYIKRTLSLEKKTAGWGGCGCSRWSCQGCMHAWMLGRFSHVQLFATPWTVPHQAPLSMQFSRQEYWSRLPFPSPGDFPDPGVSPMSPASPALQADSLLLSHQGNPVKVVQVKWITHTAPPSPFVCSLQLVIGLQERVWEDQLRRPYLYNHCNSNGITEKLGKERGE